MRLYRIVELHGAPKDTVRFTREFVLAEGEDQIWAYLDRKAGWTEDSEDSDESEAEQRDRYDGLTRPEYLRSIHGDYFDPDLSYVDSYYGITARGWKDMGEIAEADAEVLVRLGIATTLFGIT